MKYIDFLNMLKQAGVVYTESRDREETIVKIEGCAGPNNDGWSDLCTRFSFNAGGDLTYVGIWSHALPEKISA